MANRSTSLSGMSLSTSKRIGDPTLLVSTLSSMAVSRSSASSVVISMSASRVMRNMYTSRTFMPGKRRSRLSATRSSSRTKSCVLP